jgi:hypothetical protein
MKRAIDYEDKGDLKEPVNQGTALQSYREFFHAMILLSVPLDNLPKPPPEVPVPPEQPPLPIPTEPIPTPLPTRPTPVPSPPEPLPPNTPEPNRPPEPVGVRA